MNQMTLILTDSELTDFAKKIQDLHIDLQQLESFPDSTKLVAIPEPWIEYIRSISEELVEIRNRKKN